MKLSSNLLFKQIKQLFIVKSYNHVIWSFISISFASVIHFIIRSILGKLYGPDMLGTYSLAFILYQLGVMIAAFGMGASMTKYIAEKSESENDIREIASFGYITSIISGLIMFLIIFLSSNLITTYIYKVPELNLSVKLISFSFPFLAIFKTSLGVLNGQRKMKSYAILNIIWNSAIILLTIIFIFSFEDKTLGAVLALVIAGIIVGLVSFIFVRKHISFPAVFKTKNKIYKKTIIAGLLILLTNAFGFLNGQISNVQLSYYLSETETGMYSAAFSFFQILLLVPMAIQLVTTPAISSYHAKGEYENIKKLIKQTMLLIFIINLVLAGIVMIFGKFWISVLFSSDFVGAYFPLLVLVGTTLLYAPYASVGGCFLSIEKLPYVTVINGLSIALTLILNIFLIPILGIFGAAICTSLGYTFMFICSIILFKKFKVI